MEVQRFRGAHYLADGALQACELTSDGRHIQAVDPASWHFLVLDEEERIMSCARYYENPEPSFEGTAAAQSALARNPLWRAPLRSAIHSAIESARSRGMRFAELGGWCVSSSCRNSTQALRTVLSMYALGEILGGTVGLSTATKRHSSSTILQRLGGSVLEESGRPLPSYIDPKYRCEMELLQFDTSRPATRYVDAIASLGKELRSRVEVISAGEVSFTNSILALSTAINAHEPKVATVA